MSILFLVLLVIMFIVGVPVAFSIGITPVIMMILESGSLDINVGVIAQRIMYGVNNFIILAIPFFFLAGRLMNTGGMTKRIFNFADTLVGHFKGGMGHVNIVASMIFSGMTGAAASDAAGLGTIEFRAMKDAGYDDEFAVAVTGASSTIGPIIPPSLPLVMYGILSGVSIGRLLIGGIVPGVFMGLVLMVMVSYYAIKRDYPSRTRASFSEIGKSFIKAFPGLVTPIIIIGGIITGIFTPTEAAAIAVFYSLIIGVFIYGELSWRDVWDIFFKTAKDTAVITFIVATASLYGWLLIRSRVPIVILEALTAITTSKLGILLLLNILLLIVGCFMETIAAISILVPVLTPLMAKVGINPLHFGLVMVLNLMIGLLTPPFGVVLFILNKITGVPLEKVMRNVLPFLIPLLIVLLLITIFPSIVTWLPSVLMQLKDLTCHLMKKNLFFMVRG